MPNKPNAMFKNVCDIVKQNRAAPAEPLNAFISEQEFVLEKEEKKKQITYSETMDTYDFTNSSSHFYNKNGEALVVYITDHNHGYNIVANDFNNMKRLIAYKTGDTEYSRILPIERKECRKENKIDMNQMYGFNLK